MGYVSFAGHKRQRIECSAPSTVQSGPSLGVRFQAPQPHENLPKGGTYSPGRGVASPRVRCSKDFTRREMSEKEAGIEVQGKVEEASGGMYRVKLDQGPVVLAYASGRMKRFHIRIITGDRVKVELSPYDLTRGRITYRDK